MTPWKSVGIVEATTLHPSMTDRKKSRKMVSAVPLTRGEQPELTNKKMSVPAMSTDAGMDMYK